jgi:hypothetical protein
METILVNVDFDGTTFTLVGETVENVGGQYAIKVPRGTQAVVFRLTNLGVFLTSTVQWLLESSGQPVPAPPTITYNRSDDLSFTLYVENVSALEERYAFYLQVLYDHTIHSHDPILISEGYEIPTPEEDDD